MAVVRLHDAVEKRLGHGLGFYRATEATASAAPPGIARTTSQAAELLGVSRPTLIRLLEDGAIPYEQPRRHRILRLDDVLAFQKRRRSEQRALLAEATRQAVADGLYSDRAEDCPEALEAARRSAA
ncbi:MAG: helix-turn-helix domain-containing protein [Bifidobacteriaceae bacterium]|nr:helix-turn-helix domain-containing protein [Bifidobacteriaceae bacterium]